MRSRFAPSFAVGCLLAACTSSGGAGSGDASGKSDVPSSVCSSSCETNDWPRLVLGILYPLLDASQSRAATVTYAQITDSAGVTRTAVSGGCPKADGFVCTYSWSTSPNDQTVGLEVGLSDGTILTRDIGLKDFNYCARNIGYVELVISQVPEIEPTRYLSPCSGL